MQTFKELQSKYLHYLLQESLSQEPKGLYEPVNYIMNLGGKRIRPVLALMSYNLFQNDLEMALPLAHAIEMFHNFSLVHDDIMDEADLRRGKLSVHHKYDINTGILSGDVMMIKTYEYLTNLNSEKALEIISVFNLVARKVCEGQQMDMDFETSDDVQISAYLQMIEYKTAILLAGALKMGAILGGATQVQSDLLWKFGINIGLAFQLQDDILDVFGNPETFGKKIGGDIIQNKKTFLMLSLLEIIDIDDHLRFDVLRSLNNEYEKVEGIRNLYDKYLIKEMAEERMNSYYENAKGTLNILQRKFNINIGEIEILSTLLMNRIS